MTDLRPPPTRAERLRSIAFAVWFWAWAAAMALVTTPTLLLPPPVMRRFVLFWMRGIAFGFRRIVGLTFEVRGRPPEGPVVFAVKHQSAWETLTFPLIRNDVAIVLKKELADIPLFGRFTRHTGMIPVERTAGARAMRGMIEGAARAKAEGYAVLLFPEGTRRDPGVHGPYHPGVAALYKRSGMAICPVALNSGLFWPGKGGVKRPGRVIVEFLAPIPPGLDRAAFMERLAAALEPASDRLVAEALGQTAPDGAGRAA